MGSSKSKSKQANAKASSATPPKAPEAGKEKGKAVQRVQKDLEKNIGGKDAAQPTAAAAQGKAKFVRNNQWVVENQGEGVVDIKVEKMTHSVAIYGCKAGAVIKVTGKCSSVAFDGCTKAQLYVESVVGSIEVSNCQRVKIFMSGVCSSVSIDKSDGVWMQISEETANSPDFMVTAASSSEMNLSIPDGDEYKELALPEQFVHKVGEGQSIKSKPSDLYSEQ